ncbi:unnamed protein product [Rotaria sordida]|uniref:Phosphofurin acidic cluster sorting protein 2-like n=1 Tax=Rotaria sordida TaxID=392033 RepID=A0A814RYC8_9BILA|nr:unnamed protein product [Rotaria sordida]CAF1140366.1 unnamed protein product [Rotaria sordida]CAF3508071.1 unnamed protein product [Rotaria sordida]CAF3648829.1 unnamed protein product [Rotaria sordida]
MAEKTLRSNTNVQTLSSSKMATTLMAYAQLEIDNSTTCIPRLCKFSIVRIVLNRSIDNGDSNAIVVAVKIQSNKRTFRCCEIPLQQDGTLDAPVNLQYFITYPHYFKRDINKVQIYVQRRKNRPMIGYKMLAKGEVNLDQVIQNPQSMNLHLYLNTNEKSKQQQQQQQLRSINQDELSTIKIEKYPVGYVSIISLSSTIPNESETIAHRESNRLSIKPHHFDKSFNDDDEYIEEEELNSELEDSDLEFNSKNKQKFNPNILRNKLIQMFKRKSVQSTTNLNKNSNTITTTTTPTTNITTHLTNLNEQHTRFKLNRQSDIEEEDSPSDISDSTIPVDQWSIESVPKPGFTPVEHLQILKISEDEPYPTRKSTNPFDSNDSPLDSDTSDFGIDIDRTQLSQKIISIPEEKLLQRSTNIRDNSIKQFDELYTNDRLPDSIIFLYTGLNQSNITASKFKEYNLSVISLNTLTESKVVLNNLIQRIQKCTSQSVIRIVLLGNDAFVNSFLQSYVECLASRPREYMSYFQFYFVPLVFSYLAKFLGGLDSQYEILFGSNESTNEISDIRDLSQKITRYLKTSRHTLSLPVGEVMLNRKGKLPDEDSSPTFLPFFCYVCLGTLSSNESQLSSIDDNALLSASLSLSISTNQQQSRELKDSSDDENSQTILSSSPQSKIANQLIKNSHTDEPSTLPVDVSVDYWTIIDNQKEKKDGIRTIKSSLKSNIRVLTITRQLIMNSDGKISSSFTMTYVTHEKKQKIMKFGKKLKDIQNTKMIEPQTITGINRLVCTSKSHNVELKVNVDGQEWDNVKFFQISSQWHTHIKYFPLALFNDIRNTQ